MLKDLIKLANDLDSKGLRKEADYLDKVIRKLSSDLDLENPWDLDYVPEVEPRLSPESLESIDPKIPLQHFRDSKDNYIRNISRVLGELKEVWGDALMKPWAKTLGGPLWFSEEPGEQGIIWDEVKRFMEKIKNGPEGVDTELTYDFVIGTLEDKEQEKLGEAIENLFKQINRAKEAAKTARKESLKAKIRQHKEGYDDGPQETFEKEMIVPSGAPDIDHPTY